MPAAHVQARRRPRVRRIVLAMAGTAAAWAMSCAFAAAPEYQLKAVFLFQFSQFVEWPSTAFAQDDAPFTVCVLGEDPFKQYLDDAVRGEKVDGRPFAVKRLQRVEQVADCHILFIAQASPQRLDPILDALRGRSILTVADSAAFAERGGVIEFVTARNRLRLRINPRAARAADLTISSKLLSLASLVPAGPEPAP
ncbi:MAG TPA: YfiR family protein [Povalibacter sp.]|uniref:YfiR family protein n=1 Tax=Povalibacter sp. TaxID=1962978 RepID=UPI002B8B8EFA|nr:YfiR family protein [Povalibacter sp.]HMN43015.1 YfiR family protein [Povalibacter sp.]